MKPLKGTVISSKMNKTATVAVETKWQHPMYKKTIKRTKKYLAHNTIGAKDNDSVTITPIRPMSRLKRFTISSIDSNQ